MNHEPSASFVLKATADAEPPLLERVDVDGRVDGVLFAVTLRQTWRHTGTRPLEVIYTFPMPPQALLLGFAATRGAERLEGSILPRAQAETRYEEALARGDAPTLLEVGADGLHTASIGNLAPGEAVVLEVRFAQLLRFEHSRLRLVVPTTIAPRYGQPQAAGLAAHQAPLASVAAEYPLALGLTLTGSLASARIECPTHRHRVARHAGTTRFELEPGARMDRDVVVMLWPGDPRPGLLVTGRDPLAERPRQVALAAFELPRRPSHRPLSLKLLVDGSGSMAGDSIASAKAALRAIADRLSADDEVALVRFGSQVETALPPSRCSAGTLPALRQQIDATDASLGGTEMEAALKATLALPHAHPQADVLIITDGQVWQSEAVAAAARHNGQRVFAIGVGSAPAEGALRAIAAATGGACEFATPGDDLQAATVRMLERMRDTPWSALRVDWGVAPQWQQPLPATAFGGDTVIAMAAFDAGQEPAKATLALDGETTPLTAAASDAAEPEVLARLLADQERREQTPAQAQATALRYRLLTEHTHCVLAHVRSDAERDAPPADLVRVPSMLAAGWGGTGRVTFDTQPLALPDSTGLMFSEIQFDPLLETDDTTAFEQASEPVTSLKASAKRSDPGVLFSLREDVDAESPEALRQRVSQLEPLLPIGFARTLLGLWVAGQPLPEQGQRLLDRLHGLGLSDEDAWVLIAHWALGPAATPPALPDWAQARLQALGDRRCQEALRAIEDSLAASSADAWGRRARRLFDAMRR